jgi:hypothetical protein
MKKKYLQHSPKTVALVCMGPSVVDLLSETLTQEFTPDFADEIWAINMASNCFRADVIFWMDDLIEQRAFKPRLIEALAKLKVPVITSVRRPEVVPTSYDYPIEEICKMPVGRSRDGKEPECVIDMFGKPYLNNGVAMAIAYALYKGVKNFKIYGADFSYPNRDYAESGRACVEAWITVALINGMQIGLCPSTSIMDAVKDHGIYGYSQQPAVTLNDGRVFRYQKLDNSQVGKYGQHHAQSVAQAGGTGYVPEDSSGVKDGVRTDAVPVSGNGGPKRARGRPRRADRAVGPVDAAQAAVGSLSPRVRRGHSSRRAKDHDPAAHANGADDGPAPRQAEAAVLLSARPLHDGLSNA